MRANQRSCSVKCKDAYVHRTQYLEGRTAQFTCSHCGKDYWAKARNRDKYCSRACSFAAMHAAKSERDRIRQEDSWTHWWFGTCGVCAQRFIKANESSRLCSDECRKEDARRKARERHAQNRPDEPIVIQCRDCGATVICKRESGGTKRFCSKCATLKIVEYRRNHKNPQDRARHAGVPYAPVKKADVIAKHGRKCHICGKRIGLDEILTLDHVVPLALGGWHDLTNLRPAHFLCNSLKSAKYSGQLMLTA